MTYCWAEKLIKIVSIWRKGKQQQFVTFVNIISNIQIDREFVVFFDRTNWIMLWGYVWVEKLQCRRHNFWVLLTSRVRITKNKRAGMTSTSADYGSTYCRRSRAMDAVVSMHQRERPSSAKHRSWIMHAEGRGRAAGRGNSTQLVLLYTWLFHLVQACVGSMRCSIWAANNCLISQHDRWSWWWVHPHRNIEMIFAACRLSNGSHWLHSRITHHEPAHESQGFHCMQHCAMKYYEPYVEWMPDPVIVTLPQLRNHKVVDITPLVLLMNLQLSSSTTSIASQI
jgi:hypothetical protein